MALRRYLSEFSLATGESNLGMRIMTGTVAVGIIHYCSILKNHTPHLKLPEIVRNFSGEDTQAHLDWVAVKELNLSYYIGKPYYLLYIPIMVT